MYIHADLPYLCAGYDVTMYFQSEATVKKQSKMLPPTVLCRILVALRFACATNRWASC